MVPHYAYIHITSVPQFDPDGGCQPYIVISRATWGNETGEIDGTEEYGTELLFDSKQVLAVKWGVVWGPAMWGMQPDQVEPVPTEAFDLEELETTTVPTAMAASGVARVDWGIILMHRPWCMWSMSHNAREEREEDLELWATRELFETEKLVAQHRKWALDGIPVL